MSTTTTSPLSGSSASPGATSDQGGATPPSATSITERDASQGATSAEQPSNQGSTANASVKADDAFEAFTKAAEPAKESAPEPANGTTPGETPATQAEPEGKEGAQQTPTKPDEGASERELDNLPTEHASKDLRRALKSRREIKEQKAAIERELANERSTTDRLFARFEAAGIEPDTLPKILEHLGRAKHGDPAAKEFIRQEYGIESSANASGFTEEQVREAIGQALEHYDPERAIASVKAKAVTKPETQRQAPPVTQQKPPAQEPQQAANEYGMRELKAEINGMAAVIRTTFGPNVDQVTQQIEQSVQKELQKLDDLGLRAPPATVAKLYQKALGVVQARQAGNRPAQSTQLRPSSEPPRTAPRTADEQFEAYVGG